MAGLADPLGREDSGEGGTLPALPPLRIWDGGADPGPDQLAAREMMRWSHTTLEGIEPFSLQWFLDIDNVRYARQGRWIPLLLEFGKHAGETLLGLGEGLGTDWVQYARQGAEVVTCSPDQRHHDLVRRNFLLRGLRGTFLQAPASALPIEASSIDVVCMSSLPADPEMAGPVVEEVYRVLKPGGKVLALAPAARNVDYWARRLLGFIYWFRATASTSGETWTPLRDRPGYTARRLRRLFGRFAEPRHWKRHLRRADVPHLWRMVPLPILERILGRLLIFKAFKPLSAARGDSLAA